MYGTSKIGETTAGYCERSRGYFVCDILTEVFKFLFRSTGGNASGGFLAGLTGRNINGYKDNAQQDQLSIKHKVWRYR